MARFYGDLQGNRGPTSRMGSKKSGLHAHIRGWNVGVQISCFVDKNGRDTITISETGGSHDPFSERVITVLKDSRKEVHK